MSSSNAAGACFPAFFKILTTKDFTTVLRIPPAFWEKYKSDMTGNAKLVVDCGRIWNVKMERNGGVFCFTRGWSKFVEDGALRFGEFLVFTLSGNSEFHVDIYKTNFVQRQILPLPLPLPLPLLPPPTAPAPAGRSSKSKQGNPLYFEACMKKSTKHRLYLPREFVKASGLGEEKHVKVEYVGKGKGKHCSAVVAVKINRPANLYSSGTVELGVGWFKFQYESRLLYGEIYSFRFDPTRNLILVNQKESPN